MTSTSDQLSALPFKNTKKAHTDVAKSAASGSELEDATKLSSGQSSVVEKHSGKLYYGDGNVVLISKKVAFRVHRMFLASRSEVFKDMFELATHPKDGECFDGCPAIHLDDEVDDLTVFLEALYGHILIKDIQPDFPRFSTVLRLSTKYLVETLRSSCIWHLSEKMPTTLDAYDYYWHPELADFAFCYYNLVYKLNVTSLLPAALYIISTFNVFEIDQTDLVITNDLIVRLYKGRANLLAAYSEVLQKLNENKAASCNTCLTEVKASIIENMVIELALPAKVNCFDPLHMLYQAREIADCDDLCYTCRLGIRDQLDKGRQQIWENVPRIFGFACSWDQLEYP